MKQPRFYAGYTGPLRAELNLAAATASLDGAGDLILSTEAAGQIPVASTASKGAGAAASTIASSYYVFAINTGNANGPGLYPGRPNIVFDTAVTVSSTPAGVTGSIVSPNNPNGAPIALPVGSLHVNHDTIKVVVPLNLLPAGSLSPSQWRVTAFARNNPPAADFQSIASFAPDFTMFQVSKSPRALIL